MAILNTKIFLSFNIEGWHSYPKASGTHEFLKYRHRHMFHIVAKLAVTDDDREIEFIDAKADLIHVMAYAFMNNEERHGCDFESRSCEMIAKWIIDYLKHKYGDRFIAVTVSEDGENGAQVHSIPDRQKSVT